MFSLHPVLLAVPVATLFSLGLIPSRIANRAPQTWGSLVALFALLALAGSVGSAVDVLRNGPIDATFFRWESPVPLCIGFHLDAVAVVMMTLISFIGLIIARFSQRYLQGDPRQGRFFRWMSVTMGATLLLAISCNLVMFTAAWMLTSFGLHQLLLHYPERTWAVWAARKKFLISRLGDALLIAALVLSYKCFGTTEYTEIFAAANTIHNGEAERGVLTSLIGVLLVMGAMTKSAQFPFHSWLPDTMETPTPVSALMHAGVINAGGFLVIRMSPLVALSPVALDLLAVIGAFTAVLGSLVMLTQTSVKRSLAYSTIAQMGFMMLQCGLGAFAAALLHIVAHSAYKAHAFLSSGSVIDAAARLNAPALPKPSAPGNALALAAAIALAPAIVLGAFQAVGLDLIQKPGGMVLGLVLALALTQLLWNGFATGLGRVAPRTFAMALLVAAVYAVAYRGMDGLVASSTSHHVAASSPFELVLLGTISLAFAGMFVLQALAPSLAARQWVRALYVHLMNGFYIDIPARRITAWCYGQTSAVQ